MVKQASGRSQRTVRRAAIGICAVLTLAGCGQSDPSSSPNGSHNASELKGRPTLPEIVATYTALSGEIRTALSSELGDAGWSTKQPSTPTALCQDFGTDPDTGIRFLPFLIHDRFVAEPQWTRVSQTIIDTARRRGFYHVVHVVDRPDEHRVDLYDNYGGEISVQDGPRLLDIGVSTGCHLRTGTSH